MTDEAMSDCAVLCTFSFTTRPLPSVGEHHARIWFIYTCECPKHKLPPGNWRFQPEREEQK